MLWRTIQLASVVVIAPALVRRRNSTIGASTQRSVGMWVVEAAASRLVVHRAAGRVSGRAIAEPRSRSDGEDAGCAQVRRPSAPLTAARPSPPSPVCPRVRALGFCV